MAEMKLSDPVKAAKREVAPNPIPLNPRGARGWLERLWSSIAERGRSFAPIPANSMAPLERAKLLAASLLSERGEASGAAVAKELLAVVTSLSAEQRAGFVAFLADGFAPDDARLAAAAEAYLANRAPETAARLADAAEPPRQELLRRMNMATGGTQALIDLRKDLTGLIPGQPALKLLDGDLLHLFSSWFNRGFLVLRRIDWQTPAAVLEKLITYEAVHEIQGWEDLRRRLAADRRCFAFFHPALPGEPLIFVEVALTRGLAGSVRALLERDTDEAAQRTRAAEADTAIFYSISNCQDGLRGISFGNFLIKQVVEELRAELPGLRQFSTLSPIPSFRRWVEKQAEAGTLPEPALTPEQQGALFDAAGMPLEPEHTGAAFRAVLANDAWPRMDKLAAALEPALVRLCAAYLTQGADPAKRRDPVAKFHLGNGARLERINWMGNPSRRGLKESYGLMVNYLYDPSMIEANHEGFVRDGTVARAPDVEALLAANEPEDRAGKGSASFLKKRSRKLLGV